MSDTNGWKPGPPSRDRLGEGWVRQYECGCVLLKPYRVRYSGDTLRLEVFTEHGGGWERQGTAFYPLILDHCEAPAAAEFSVRSNTFVHTRDAVAALYREAR